MQRRENKTGCDPFLSRSGDMRQSFELTEDGIVIN